jgi:hypothetical protein
VNNPLDIKENDKHTLDFALHLSRLFSVSVSFSLCARLILSSPNSCLIIGRVSVALFRD